jgi:hypothetical protein
MSDDQTFTKCAWRLIPFMGLLYLINFLVERGTRFERATLTLARSRLYCAPRHRPGHHRDAKEIGLGSVGFHYAES